VLIIRTSLGSLIPVKQTNGFLNRRNRTVRGIVGIWGSYQLQVVLALYLLSAIGRSASGATVVYTGTFFLPYTFTGILSITEKLHCIVCNT
jgi:hypothetical protein